MSDQIILGVSNVTAWLTLSNLHVIFYREMLKQQILLC